MIDYRRLLDRPEKSAQTAAERPIHNTHTQIHPCKQAVRRRWDSWVIACSHSLICITRPAIYNGHERHFTRTRIHTPAQTVFGIALALMSVNRRSSGERVSRQWLTHTTGSSRLSGFFFCSVFHALESVHSTHGNILHSIVFVILCKSDVCCWSYCGLPFVCVCVVSLAGCVSVCVWVFVKHSELKFKSMRWIISL